jgi:Xaa-Pro aminopeptidase
MFSTHTYSQRRTQLAQDLKTGVILLPGNEESSMNYADNLYHFRQDSSFLYFTGIDRPYLALAIDAETGEEFIFGDDQGMDDIVWTGPLSRLNEQAARAGVTTVKSMSLLPALLQKAVAKGRKIHYVKPYRPEMILKLSAWLNVSIQQLNEQVSLPLIKAIIAQRSIKSAEEITAIEKSVDLTVDMHAAAIMLAREGMNESELAGRLQGLVVSGGGQLAFPTILTVNGQYLHNHAGGNLLQNGQLVLCDGGAESATHYAGDMTRTFPAGKKFTSLQGEAYDIVLQAHTAAVAMLKPGVLFRDAHFRACEVLTDGLKQLGLMKGDTKEAVQQGAHALFFQCGLGHMMGLDVHDMENLGEEYVGYSEHITKSAQFGLKSLRLGKALEEGFVLTIEPGLYFNAYLMDEWQAAKKHMDFINYEKLDAFKTLGGIRIEDDYVITTNGSRLLGKELVRDRAGIEAMRIQ